MSSISPNVCACIMAVVIQLLRPHTVLTHILVPRVTIGGTLSKADLSTIFDNISARLHHVSKAPHGMANQYRSLKDSVL